LLSPDEAARRRYVKKEVELCKNKIKGEAKGQAKGEEKAKGAEEEEEK